MRTKRPKVRYVANEVWPPDEGVYWIVEEVHDGWGVPWCRTYYGERHARRIAAALNFHEAHKRGEL